MSGEREKKPRDFHYGKNTLSITEKNFQNFLKKKHFRNDFYVTGESYAGKYVPALAYKIHTENTKKGRKKRDMVPLKGIAIGDGLCDPVRIHP